MSVMPDSGSPDSAAFMLTRAWVQAAVVMVPVTVGAGVLSELAWYRVISWAWLVLPAALAAVTAGMCALALRRYRRATARRAPVRRA